ncbi:MAG: hypothetical protein HZB12_02710 [Candidatus Yonathbacteria bacterium]|nr:hypothetical protein [Candidatus Yonathbacteria bacterium]
MNKLLFTGFMLMSVPFISFAQIAVTGTPATPTVTISTVDPGLVPGDFFYFLDRWGEGLNTFLTFNKEKKARLHLEYAKERVAEMKDVLAKPNAKLEDVASARENFDAQVADAATIVKNEKDSGSDVADLARELDDELDQSRVELKDVFQGHRENAGRAETEIRAKIDAITASGMASNTSANELQGLTQALESITKEKGLAHNEENGIDADLSDKQALLEEIMGPQMAAEKHLKQAMRLRGVEGMMGQVPPQAQDQLMKQAQEAMKRGDFETAKRISKDAERGLENARMMRGAEEMGMPSTSGVEMMDGIDAGATHLDNLERGMQEGERMMEELDR